MSATAKRPNILLVMCDQLSALATSPYGNGEVITPNMAALAERGTTFENAYCNAPLCAPSRASMMTGRLPDSIPVNDNAEELPSTVPTFAHHLRRAGYKTVLSGKMHFVGPDQMHGFEERLTTDIYPADLQWAQDWETLGNPPRDPEEELFGRYMAHMVAEAGPVPWSVQLDYDEEVHFRALERIRQLSRGRQADADNPWFMCVSYTQPHDPYAPAQEYWDLYEGREIATPEAAPEGYQETAWDTWVNAYHGVDVAAPTEEETYRARRGYYAMTTYIDEKLGQLQRELERFGELDNTVVIFLSDHGDMIGENGMFFKRTFREWSTRIPLIFAGPQITAGERVSSVASLVDLFPTILGIATVDMGMPEVSGLCSGRDLLATAAPTVEPSAIIDYNGEGTIAPTRTVVRDGYKYVYVHGEDELLFHLESDPKEWKNLAADPDHAEALQALRGLCFAEWDAAEAEARILSSQKRRVFLNEALSKGLYRSWDYQPVFDAARMYVRRPITEVWDRGSINQWSTTEGGG